MKKFLLAIVVIILFAIQLIAQNPHSQNKILEIQYNNHKASDFGLSNAKDVVDFEQKSYRIKFMDIGYDLQHLDIYELKNKQITSHISKSIFSDGSDYTTNNTFTYKNNDNTLYKKTYHSKDGKDDQEYTYKLDKKGIIIEIRYNRKNKNEENTTYIKYDNASKTIEKYGFDYKGDKYSMLKFKTDTKGNIIEKFKKGTKYSPEDKKWEFEYDENEQIIRASQSAKTEESIKFNTNGISDYIYNDKRLIIKENGNYSESDFNIDNENHYEYVYDKYNNWIAKYQYTTSYGYQDLSAENYKRILGIWLRKITYKNGDVTGEINEKGKSVQEYLNAIEKNNPFETKVPPKVGVYWSKSNDNSFKFFENGKNISGQFNFVKLLKSNYYANDSIKNIVYKITNFTTKPIQKEYYKATVFAQKDEGIWFKVENGNFWFYINGIIPKNITVKHAISNIKDQIIYIDNIPKYVIFFEDTNPFEMQKAIHFEDYLKTHPNEGKKDVIEEIPLGAIWKKADNGGFWFYFNGESRSQLNYIYYGNHCVIYDPLSSMTYLLDNIKNETVGKFLKAIPHPGNKFWYKSTTESFEVIINGQKDATITSGDYTQNGIDVVTINKNNQKEYVLKDYKNQPLFLLYPVTNYSDYSEKPSAVYLENEEFKKCKDDGKCYAGLFNIKVASILSDTNISDKPKELSTYMEKIYRVNPSMVQKVGILTHTENLGLYLKAKKLLPQHIQDDIAKRSRQMIEDYNKYINSKEVRDKVKENGGGYIKSKN